MEKMSITVFSVTEMTIEQGKEQQSGLDWCKKSEWQVDEEPLEDYSRDDSSNKSLKRRLVEKI